MLALEQLPVAYVNAYSATSGTLHQNRSLCMKFQSLQLDSSDLDLCKSCPDAVIFYTQLIRPRQRPHQSPTPQWPLFC